MLQTGNERSDSFHTFYRSFALFYSLNSIVIRIVFLCLTISRHGYANYCALVNQKLENYQTSNVHEFEVYKCYNL